VKALEPTAVIELREMLTGSARAARIRNLTTPSWAFDPHPAIVILVRLTAAAAVFRIR
jgi:hypothetical protein